MPGLPGLGVGFVVLRIVGIHRVLLALGGALGVTCLCVVVRWLLEPTPYGRLGSAHDATSNAGPSLVLQSAASKKAAHRARECRLRLAKSTQEQERHATSHPTRRQ